MPVVSLSSRVLNSEVESVMSCKISWRKTRARYTEHATTETPAAAPLLRPAAAGDKFVVGR